MNKEETNALLSFIGEISFDRVSITQLEQLATNHPYFPAAQLLLAKKMLYDNHPEAQQQLKKTALYFPNELWLRYLLYDEENDQPSAISHRPSAKTKTETLSEDVNLITLPAEGILTEMPDLSTIREEPEEAPLDDEETAAQIGPLPMEESNQKIAAVLSEQAKEFEKPVEESAVPVQAEPCYAVDYFASQGIQLEPKKEESGFDKKVHKFTDWLRQMKRINPHPADLDLGTNVEEESYVANIAASSNQIREVITESMAEVLLKQNKSDKAIEIYEKLSLLYPFKNAYFAAKIDSLKQ